MSDQKRSILLQVKEGTLSPEEAAALLADLERSAAAQTTPPPDEPPSTLRTVRIVGVFRSAKIVGDPTVSEALVEGAHVAKRSGDRLVIEGDPDGGEHGSGRFTFSRKRNDDVVIGLGSRPAPLTVRVNPAIAIDVELAAGTLSIEGVRAPIKAEVSAGAARIEGFASPIDVQVASGTVKASGVLSSGSSRIRCEAGAVRVHLERGSSVRLTARSGLGKVSLPGMESGRGVLIGGGSQEGVVGGGAATLEAETGMGVVTITSDE